MRAYELDHLTDRDLLVSLTALVGRERATTAELLAHIAEVDARKLYAPAGYPSMFTYCVGELHLSEDAAYKRIQAARSARRFPAIYEALAEGRLHLTGVGMLAPYLTRENSDELLRAATHRTKSEIEELLALRFPGTELLPLVQAPRVAGRADAPQVLDPIGSGGERSPEFATTCDARLAPAQVGAEASPDPASCAGSRPCGGGGASCRSRRTPIAPGRYTLQLTIDGDTHEMLRHAQDLLGHAVPSGDLAEVLKRALGAYVKQLERRRFAATDTPRPRRRRKPANDRNIPAHVKRAVWRRDGGRCTFVGPTGRRCNARRFLEFDHIEPVARGGQASIAGMRLRCRVHNQLEAERVFGKDFMDAKREDVRAGRTTEHAENVAAALRGLGFRAEETRRAIEHCAATHGITLEDQVRAALRFLRPARAVTIPCAALSGRAM